MLDFIAGGEEHCSNELNSRVKELTAEMEKMKLDNWQRFQRNFELSGTSN